MSALEMIKRAVAAGASQEVIDNLAKAGAYSVKIRAAKAAADSRK